MQERIAILGASRGLGAALWKRLVNTHTLFLASRKIAMVTSSDVLLRRSSTVLTADFSRFEDQHLVIDSLSAFDPQRIYYVAAGGPFGNYGEKSWKDHAWSLEVSLVFPARVLFESLNRWKSQSLKQVVFTGSAIAEREPDPQASSYAASKHGLHGLVSSVRAENPDLDVRLFSPGYMDTALLPANAWPRQKNLAMDPDRVAEEFLRWSFQPDESWHKLYK